MQGEGQHWPIVLAAFITQVFTHGFAGCMGVFYVEWKEAFGPDLPGDGSSTIGWLTSSVLGVLLSTAPLSGALAHHFGVRPVVMLGGLLALTGLFISSFAPTIDLLFFTVPLTGLGCGLAYAASITIITQYFHKHFALASGISSTGISIGVICLPVIVQALVNYFTWRNAIMIVAGFVGQVMVCGALMKPPADLLRTETKRERTSNGHQERNQLELGTFTQISTDNDVHISDKSVAITGSSNLMVVLDSLGISLIWTNRVYAFCLPMFFCNGAAYATTLIYIKERAEGVGFSDFQAALLLSVIGVAGFFARAGHGRFIDKKIIHPAMLYAFANLQAAIALPILAVTEHYAWFVICVANIGFAAGLYIALNIVIVRHMVGVHRFPGGMGLALLNVAMSIMSTVTISGLLLDYTGDYLAGFLYASFVQGMCGILALIYHFIWTRCIIDPRWPPPLPRRCRTDFPINFPMVHNTK